MKLRSLVLLSVVSMGMVTMTASHGPSLGLLIPLIPIAVLTGHSGLWGSGLTGAALLKLKAAAAIAGFLAVRKHKQQSHGWGWPEPEEQHGGWHRKKRAIEGTSDKGEQIDMREYDPSLDEVLQYDQLGCGLRLVCELSASSDDKLQEDEKLILELFGRGEKAPNPTKSSRGKLSYSYAALLGSHAKDAGTCSRVYGRCPYNSTQIMQSLRDAHV